MGRWTETQQSSKEGRCGDGCGSLTSRRVGWRRNRTRRGVLGAVFCLAVLWGGAEEPVVQDEPVFATAEVIIPELEPILRTALRQSPRVFQARLAKLQADQLTLVSSSVLYPHLDATLAYDRQREERNEIWANGERLIYNAGISYPLFHWGALRAGVQIGKIQAEIAANNLKEAYRLAALEVRREYLQLILTKASLRAAEFRLGMQRDNLELVRSRVEAGELPSYTLTTTEIAVDDAQLSYDRAKQGLDVAVSQFRRLAGLDDFDVAAIPEEIPEVAAAPEEEAAALREAFVEEGGYEHLARYENKELELRRERLNLAILRVNQRPKIDLRTGVSQDELARETDITRRSTLQAVGIGVRVRWNIFDGFASRGRRLSVQTTLRRLQQDLETLTEDLKDAAERALVELDFAGRSLIAAERRFGPVPQNLRRAREDLELGVLSEEAVREAESRLYSAQITVFSARAAYLNALANFLSTVNADPALATSGVHDQ